ncbi:hypothetical protein B0J11DRAFT_281410 [Dendryphion nanum]|uniref:Rhodopsin domain-containing protein n=1 Tax=Dendryphion nanum TaxID=256645 RepID=A0A9P9DWN8_9PLEO|nr:hypothetical protein B0J11DRAFT_281410 [Dendryphion nanum]
MSDDLVPIENPSQRLLLGVQITFAILSTTAVTLRIWARIAKDVEIQWDDYLIIIALVLSCGLIACDMIGTIYCGVGMHVMDVVMKYGPDRLITFFKILVPVQILWATSLAATKCSILLFYCRVFPIPRLQATAKILAVVVFLWCSTVILCSFLLCRPFAFNWDQTIPNGVCGNRVLSYILTGVLNIITDVAVLCLPLPVILKLQMRTASKIGLVVVFTTGFFVCIVSAIRLRTLLTLDYTDITYSVTSALIWSMLEPSIGITLACVPVLKNLFPQLFRTLRSSKQTGSGENSGGTSRSAKKTNGGFQALDEYPLQPGSNASTSSTKGKEPDFLARERSGSGVADSESVVEGSGEVRREGPLDRPASRQPGLKKNIVTTRKWGSSGV